MRTIVFAVALLILTASAHAAAPAPHAIECKENIAQIDGHEVVTRCNPNGVTEEWRKGGERDRADSPAVIERDAKTGIVTYEEWWKNGKQDRADGPAMIWHDPTTGTATYEAWFKDGEEISPPSDAPK